ncbi:hypothetical protein N0V87_004093 [Didymella glomerata]|uniref:SET domain-containing protein n=1 Tax=Didymella glomerata TaxID=749621 RepID=A0A9W8X1N0_9PLEO|nr:hypothetical protein N0V87_004093 [Didymella glomerata]
MGTSTMPPKRTTPAAQAQAPLETDLNKLSSSEDQEQKVGDKHPPSVPGKKKKKRKNKNRTNHGSRPSKSATVEDANDLPETESVGEAGFEEVNGTGTISPPSDTDTIATEPLPQFRFGRTLPQTPGGSYIEAPVSAHYELRELPSVGDDEDDNDEGLFATQDIGAGTRIISEQPLFTLPAPGDQVPQLMAAYENLSTSDQDAIWNLRPAAATASDALMNLRYLADALHADLENIEGMPEKRRTAQDKKILVEMPSKLQYAMNVYRVVARWHANRSSLVNIPLEERDTLPNGTPITGLFIERAHIRHSCVPNCFASYDAELGRMNVHVTRDIQEGEELTCSSFADDMYYSNAVDRKEELFNWGLTCECEACDSQHAKYETHETARTRAHTRVVMLTDTLTRLERGDDLTEVHAPLRIGHRAANTPQDELNTAQKLLLDLVRDLKTSGCESVETVRWRNILVDRILPARALVIPEPDILVAWQVILHHARESERIGKMCYGEDREDFRVLRQTREGAEATITMIEEAIAAEEAAKDLAEGSDGDEDGAEGREDDDEE